MTALILGGDMLVMAFMVGLVTWLALGSSDGELDRAARLPLEDDADVASASTPTSASTPAPTSSPGVS